jgi:hypothetical protein
MPHIDAKEIKQFILIFMADMGEQSFPRWRFRPEIARGPIRLFVPQCGVDSFPRCHVN